MPSEVREWLASTFTRQTALTVRSSEDKPRFRSIVHAVQASIFVERSGPVALALVLTWGRRLVDCVSSPLLCACRMYRQASNAMGINYPPNVITELKVLEDQFVKDFDQLMSACVFSSTWTLGPSTCLR